MWVGTSPIRVRRYARGAILLHWLLAVLFAFQLGLGWRMDGAAGPQRFAVFQLHKSIGITILLLTFVRLAWRLRHRPPPFSDGLPKWQRAAARWTHRGFYVLLVGLPLSGWIIVSSSRTGIPTILYGLVPWPHLPGLAELATPTRARVNGAAELGHVALSYLTYGLIALHLLGALKHQWIDRDGEAGRMIPARPARLSIAVAMVLALFAGAAVLGRFLPLHPVVVRPSARAGDVAPAATPHVPTPPATIAAKESAKTASAEPAPSDPAGAAKPSAPSAWTVRKTSSLGFHTAWSQGPVNGHFERWTAAILFDPEMLDRSRVSVSIDMSSARTGVSDTETALPQDDWFASALHPTATYHATRFTRLGPDRFRANGTLTLRGISGPVPLEFKLVIQGDVATMTGTARIDRTAFGVGQGEWAGTSDLPAGVEIDISVTADRKQSHLKGDKK